MVDPTDLAVYARVFAAEDPESLDATTLRNGSGIPKKPTVGPG